MSLGVLKGWYDIEEYWEGKEDAPLGSTYYIGRMGNGKFTLFGKDWGNTMTIEARGRFDTYKEARDYLSKSLRFKGRMKKIQ